MDTQLGACWLEAVKNVSSFPARAGNVPLSGKEQQLDINQEAKGNIQSKKQLELVCNWRANSKATEQNRSSSHLAQDLPTDFPKSLS